MTTPEGFRHVTRLTVRFGDMDAMGHVNNAKFLTYMEQGRILYTQDVVAVDTSDWNNLGIILARVELDYKLPITFGETVIVYTRCSRIGNKSFDLDYVVLLEREDGNHPVAAMGKSVMVAYDYATGQTIPIADRHRQRIIAYEPALDG